MNDTATMNRMRALLPALAASVIGCAACAAGTDKNLVEAFVNDRQAAVSARQSAPENVWILLFSKGGDVGVKELHEVGGRSKGSGQIAGKKDAFLALDEIPAGSGQRIPLWLFGCLY
jgi:hypothetical protein